MEAPFRQYFELGLIGMAISSPGKGCIEVNDELCQILGYTREEMLALSWPDLAHPDDRSTGDSYFDRLLRGEIDRYTLEKRCVRKDGRVIDTISSVKCMRRPDGSVEFVFAMIQDITVRKQSDQQLQRAKEAAEDAARLKEEFLATISHELRNPLAAILLWAKLLEAGKVEERDRPNALRSIVAAAEAQKRMIEDLLDVSRMVSGRLRLNMRETELGPLIHAAADAVRPMADAKGVHILLTEEVALTVLADADRLQQVVWNLFTNAVKFTSPGGQVQVHAERQGGAARITVRDTGRGISPDFLPFVFDRFRQAEGSATRTQGGLGVGLAIVRELVQLHGGTVAAESAGEGEGSTFTVELPLIAPYQSLPSRRPMASDRAPDLSAALRGKRVLLVEDDAHTRMVLQSLLELSDAEVSAVSSAAEAIDTFVTALGSRPFDVLVSDIGMSGQDGHDLLRIVRAVEHERGKTKGTPAVALTAYAREEDRRKVLSSGYYRHLAKPIGPDALVAAIVEALDK